MLPLTPTKLGRYEIVDEIGKGAMGVVYLARDPLIGRLVALKTFRIGYSVKDQELEQFRIRFMREAQSAGILTHPNIVTIHDVVEQSEEGLAFIAMEYVRGTNLKLVLQGDQPLSPQFVLDVISQVGDALDYAHSNKVIHRDVKPANILITAENRVKITDFGIARLETSNLTMEGQLLGTPNYMAPEQIQGKEVDHRADLFSLGVVLYEMLTRHKPFQGENLTVVSHRIVYDHFTPPQEFVRELPPGIEPVLHRALEKDASKRYQKARELVEDLRRVLVPSAAPPAVAAAVPPPPPAGQDLNDTMSLNQTVVLPPAPTPPPAGPAPAAKGAPKKAPRPGGGNGRPVLVGALAFVTVVVLAVAGMLLWRSWTQPEPLPAEATVEPADGAEFASLINQGRLVMATNPARAAELFRQAEPLAPPEQRAEIAGLLKQAQDQAALLQQTAFRQKTITDTLTIAATALLQREYDRALVHADQVLFLDPANLRAAEIRKKAQEGKDAGRRRTRPTPTAPLEPSPQAEVTIAAVPEPSPVQPEPEVARNSTLHIDLQSQFPSGTLMIYLDDVLRFRQTFGGKGGLFRGRREGATLSKSIEVPAGVHKVRIHVAPDGKKAKVQPYASANFSGGSSRTLVVRISEDGESTISLN